MIAPRAFSSRLRRWPLGGLHTAIVLLCLGLSLSATIGIWDDEEEDAQSEFHEEAQNRFAIITSELDAQLRLFETSPSFWNGSGEAQWDSFHAFAQEILTQNRMFRELAWVPHVTGDKRNSWEQSFRKRKLACAEITEPDQNGKMIRAKSRADYFPILFSDPAGQLPAGCNLALPLPKSPTAPGGKRTAQALTFNLSKSNLSRCALIYPIFSELGRDASTNSSGPEFKGYVLGELELNNMFESLFDRFRQIGMDVEIRDVSAGPDGITLFRYLTHVTRRIQTTTSKGPPPLTLDHRFNFAGRSWSVHCVSVPGYFEAKRTWEFWTVLGSGAGVTGVVSAFLFIIGRQGQRVQILVEKRTDQLTQVNRGLEQEVRHRAEIERQLESSLAVKEVLLREVNHRVNNNLQVICSLLQLHAHHLSDVVARAATTEMRERVRSMALVYERLQSAENLTEIDFSKYVQKLATELYLSHKGRQNGIDLQLDLQNIVLDLDTAIPCGLILTELLTNALKYAFAEKGNPKPHSGFTPTISVLLQATPDAQNLLSVRDNGVGLPTDTGLETTRTMGLQVVKLMVEQLNGRIVVDQNNGTAYTITFLCPATAKEPLA